MSDQNTLSGVDALRLEQARRLQQSVVASCLIVEAVIITMSPLFFLNDQPQLALIWVSASSFMVLIVYAYSRLLYPEEINEQNYESYLRGHIVISCITGSVWGGISIYQIDVDSLLSLYIATMIPTSITLGGMFPSSAYRATYIGILTCCVLPVSAYWFITLPVPINYWAIGFLIYYTFGLIASARTEINMRDLVLANETHALNEQLREQNAAIEKANEERSKFMLATVHDFSQPLHAQGYFIHTLRNLMKDEEQLNLLNRIEASWQSQGDLLQGIADITRFDGGLIQSNPAVVDAADILETVGAEFSVDLNHKGLDLKLETGPCLIETDPALLTRIIRNLLSNALRNTPTGGQITLSSSMSTDTGQIQVQDTGTGIAPKDQDRIFREYVQLDHQHRDQQGLGLGLSIVQRLTSLLGIKLDLESIPGEGSTFTLTLERAFPTDVAYSDKQEKTASNEKHLVFLVDDKADIIESMTETLVSWDCDVVTARGIDDAVQTLGNLDRVPSLLIVDYRLEAGESGLDLLDKLREEVNQDIPALLMTGDVENPEGLDTADNVTVLLKPVAPDQLRSAISGVHSQ